MPMPAAEIARMIKQSLPDAEVEITDLAGDDNHFAAVVISSAFVGKSKLQQHQLVYKALGGNMGGALHALQLKTFPPQ
jgi:stress-induced morphogen